MGCSNGKSIFDHNQNNSQLRKNLEIDSNCQIIKGHNDSISKLLMLKDGRLCSSSWDGTIKIWNKLNIYKCDETIKNPNNESFVCCIQMNNFLLAGDSDNSIFQFEINNTKENEKNNKKPINNYIGHSDAIFCLLSLNNNEFASCSEDTLIIIWELNNTSNVKNKLIGHKGKVNKIILLNNGNLASCSNDCTIKIWDYKNKNCDFTLDSDSCCMDIIQIKNCKLIASYINKDIKIWDINNMNITHLYHSNNNYISTIFEYKNNKIIICYYDGEIEFWDCEKEKKEFKNKRWHYGNISSVTLLNGKFISGGYDNLIKIWNNNNYV